MPFLMQAASSVDGDLFTWVSAAPDFDGAGYPGDGSATNIVILGFVNGPGYEGLHGRIYPPIYAEKTTSATGATALISFPIGDERECVFDLYVTHSRGTNTTKAGGWKRQFAFRRTSAGSPTAVGSVVLGTDLETTAGDDVGVTLSSNSAVVMITAADADVRHWLCELRVQESRAT